MAEAAHHPSARPLEVLPLLQSFELSGYELVVISLETWTIWFKLRWAAFRGQLGDEDSRLDFERIHGGPWRAEDDRGAAYDGIGAGGGGGPDRWVADAWFSPQLDPAASSLSVRFRSASGESLERVACPLR